MYRTAEWQQHERIIGKKLKRKSWYGANVESVVFCQATPNEILRKSLQEEVKKSGLNIRVVEKGGRNVKSLLQRSDVKPEKSCNDPSCVVCLTSSRGQCRHSGFKPKEPPNWSKFLTKFFKSASLFFVSRYRKSKHSERILNISSI